MFLTSRHLVRSTDLISFHLALVAYGRSASVSERISYRSNKVFCLVILFLPYEKYFNYFHPPTNTNSYMPNG